MVCVHQEGKRHRATRRCMCLQGKAAVPGRTGAVDEVMKGATFKGPIPDGWSDLRKRHARQVTPPVPDDTVRHVLLGTASECSFMGLQVGAPFRDCK